MKGFEMAIWIWEKAAWIEPQSHLSTMWLSNDQDMEEYPMSEETPVAKVICSQCASPVIDYTGLNIHSPKGWTLLYLCPLCLWKFVTSVLK